MEFKVDENLPAEACQLLRQAGHDAMTVVEQNLGGHPDSEIAAVCKTESRILLTLDTDFANTLAYPPYEFSGIIVIRSKDQSKSTIATFLLQIIDALKSESPRGDLWIVEPHRIRIRTSPNPFQ